MNVRFEPCAHCGAMRNPDLTQPCSLCGSRKFPLLGYSYVHEARALIWMIAIISVILAAAVLIGAVVLIFFNLQLHVGRLFPVAIWFKSLLSTM